MKPLIVLLSTFLTALVANRILRGSYKVAQSGRVAMATMLLFTAIGHFVFTEGMAAMIPDFIPWKQPMIIVTGIMEGAFAIGLLLPKYRVLTGWLLIVFLVLILPANIKAAIEHLNFQTGGPDGPGPSYLWVRMPLQILFILWVYFSAIKQRKNC